jgi:hypothetical protein
LKYLGSVSEQEYQQGIDRTSLSQKLRNQDTYQNTQNWKYMVQCLNL